MYYAGLLLQYALENLKKSTEELADLQEFQKHLGFCIHDPNLLKKVLHLNSSSIHLFASNFILCSCNIIGLYEQVSSSQRQASRC